MEAVSVIKYEGNNRTFVWKHPTEDFYTSSQLIVHESQEAIFFLNGRALDSFGPGRHTLETQNLPLLGRLINAPAGGQTPFHAEVYFVNLVEQMGIPWGTNSKVQFMEPTFNFPLSIGAFGEMALAVRNPRKLLIKIVGTEAILSQDALIGYMRMFLQTRIKSALANAIRDRKLCIFEMDAQLEELSVEVKKRLAPDFEEYGLELTQMLVTNVERPESDPMYRRFKELYFRQYADVREAEINQQVSVINQETEAKRTVIQAQATATKRQLEGYTYAQERGFDVAERVADNAAVGEFAGVGIGMGMLSGVSGPIGQVVGATVGSTVAGANLTGAVANVMPAAAVAATAPAAVAPAAAQTAPAAPTVPAAPVAAPTCPTCGAEVRPTWKLCPECGTPLMSPTCKYCGAELKPTWKLCPECGTPR